MSATEECGRAVIDCQADLLDLYHEAYSAHHGDAGPSGCPLCAEFSPRVAATMERLSEAIEQWRLSAGCLPVTQEEK